VRLKLILVLLICGYATQLGSPLRVDHDSTHMLTVAASFADGHGLKFYGQSSVFPVGYSLIAGVVDKAGFGTPAGFIFANLIFLLLAAASLYIVISDVFEGHESVVFVVLILFLSSFVVIKYFPMPRTEIAALGATFLTLAGLGFAQRENGIRKWILFSGSLAILAFAISIRSVSVTLIPAFAWALIPAESRSLKAMLASNRARATLFSAIIVFGGLIYWILTSTHYLQGWMEQFAEGGAAHQVWYISTSKMQELGQIALNVPDSFVPDWFRSVSKGAGLILGALLFRGLWLRRSRLGPVDIFMLANIGVLMVWPGNNPRFWLQVMPFIAIYVILAVRPVLDTTFGKRLGVLYVAVYLIIGIAAQARTADISYSGEAFPSRYGSGSLESTYESAYKGTPPDDDFVVRTFMILLRYDPRSSDVWDEPRFDNLYIPDFGVEIPLD
jgi:hypothetical protein